MKKIPINQKDSNLNVFSNWQINLIHLKDHSLFGTQKFRKVAVKEGDNPSKKESIYHTPVYMHSEITFTSYITMYVQIEKSICQFISWIRKRPTNSAKKIHIVYIQARNVYQIKEALRGTFYILFWSICSLKFNS